MYKKKNNLNPYVKNNPYLTKQYDGEFSKTVDGKDQKLSKMNVA